jgi:hypothetical protein
MDPELMRLVRANSDALTQLSQHLDRHDRALAEHERLLREVLAQQLAMSQLLTRMAGVDPDASSD